MKMIVILIVLLAGILSGCIEKENIPDGQTDAFEWCKAGTKSAIANKQGQTISETKGITTYKDKRVCEVEYTYDQGSTIKYFTEDGKYIYVIYKNSFGDVINEAEINHSAV